MNVPPERWHEIDALFETALDLPPDQRDSFLREHCGDDEKLYRLVKELLDASDDPNSILEMSLRHRAIALWAAIAEFRDANDSFPDEGSSDAQNN